MNFRTSEEFNTPSLLEKVDVIFVETKFDFDNELSNNH